MADVFISYARQDRVQAAMIGEFLTGHGFSVWWDKDINAGTQFTRVIEEKIKAASAVVVL